MKKTSKPTLRNYFKDNPDVAAMWSPHNDDALLDVTIGSPRKALWICDVYHTEYEKSIYSKIHNPDSCSVCSGSTVFPGYNDLQTVHPEIAAQWSDKNDFSPNQVKYSSSRYAWFICSKGHEWKTRISHRTSAGSSCPTCQHELRAESTRSTSIDNHGVVTDDETMRNFFVKNTTRDGVPTKNSHDKCLWRCDKGHGWITSPRDFNNCPYCAGRRSSDGTYRYVPNLSIADNEHLCALYAQENDNPPHDVALNSATKRIWICGKGHSWEAYPYAVNKSIQNGHTCCPQCVNRISSAEQEIVDMIRSYGFNVQQSNRSIISPYELDIYIPTKNIAIEYNGLYWHTESQGKDRYYHYNKWKMCNKKNIQLITIWEDDWKNNKDVVISMILHKLGVSTQQKTYARKTSGVQLTYQDTVEFMNTNHIQGATPGTVYFGLKNQDGDLIAISVWRKNKSVLYLDRYATSQIVVGGMGKLLKMGLSYARDNSLTTIITFSDHEVSDGQLYEKLGFTADKELKPDYKYMYQGKRVHKFNFRKKRFATDPELLYEPDLTEKQLAELNKIDKVYDCGKTRWVLDVS